MASIPPPNEPQPAPFGVARDLQRLTADGTATAAELREFLGQMRGRRPQEVLGLVAGSGLVKSMLVATLGCVVLLAGLTVIPYFLYHRGPKPAVKAADAKAAAAAPAEAAAAKTPASTADADASPVPAAAAETPAATTAPPEHVQRAIKAMGMDETKVADPKKNPLEHSLDKLLDKVE